MKQELYKKLEQYGKKGRYPFHMPGHKRNGAYAFGEGSGFSLDITEIEGFDNLHHPEGVIWEAQERAARLYQVKETFFSVNGSTAPLLAAICASCSRGSTLLLARNCHKAVYHGAYLWQLKTRYLYPEQETLYGLNGGISPEAVRRALWQEPNIQAVVITSPTYDGVVSDVAAIADIVHEAGAILIVDAAHGAHLKFSSVFPPPAESLGADLVIQSVHKTLPAMTQTALLHRCSHRVSHEKLQQYLGIYQSSSPSYVLMGSIDACICKLFTESRKAYETYTKQLLALRESLSELHHIHLAGKEVVGQASIYDYDCSKLVLSVRDCALTGSELADALRKQYGLEMEMEAMDYVLALTSMCDTREGFARLEAALKAIDASLEKAEPMEQRAEQNRTASCEEAEQVLPLHQAMDGPKNRCALALSTGKIAGEFVYLYPPGIPILVPGERITFSLVERIFESVQAGLHVQGLSDYSIQSICVVED